MSLAHQCDIRRAQHAISNECTAYDVFILKIYSHWILRVARDEHRANVPEPLVFGAT